MNEYKEIKQIAKAMAKIHNLEKQLSDKLDCEGIIWTTAEFVSLDKEDIEHFKNNNGETEEYFVEQRTGYCEDDYHGYLFFKSDVPGQFVRVYFAM